MTNTLRIYFCAFVMLVGCTTPKLPDKISGSASTETPNSPAVTGDGNVITYKDDRQVKPKPPAVKDSLDELNAEIGKIAEVIQFRDDLLQYAIDCTRQTPEEWERLKCTPRMKKLNARRKELWPDKVKP